MIFGKIEYLNLLPFHIFMKRYTKGSSAKMAMEYKKNVPSSINKAFLHRRVDAAFISSAVAKHQNFVALGIIAKKKVQSVLVLPSQKTQEDSESATSNRLAKVLHVEGKVIIGDKALRYALSHDDYIDLAQLWYKQTQLPFVFALLCYHKDKKYYTKIAKAFTKKEFKIPQYLLKKASKQTNIPPQEILKYLQLISYKLDIKALQGLHKFYTM
jgi:chorismate dehydratase